MTSQDLFLIVKYPPTDPLTPAGPVVAVLAEYGTVLKEYGTVLTEYGTVFAEYGKVLANYCIVLPESGTG